MPLPFGDGSFPACKAHFVAKGDSAESAEQKCGAIQAKIDSAVASIVAQYEVSVASASWFEKSTMVADFGQDQLFEKNGKRFAKIFLISDSANMKKWAVTPDSIAKRIRTFIGRPYISEPALGHFDSDHLPIHEILQKQEKYRAGTIREVVTSSTGTSYAIVEFADTPLGEKAWKEMKNGKAIYSSPAVAGFSVQENGVKTFFDWFGLHLARVDSPAYGVFHASLKQTCEGDERKCMDMLVASASLNMENCSHISNTPNCSQMQAQNLEKGWAEMTDEEKKKKHEEMLNANASLKAENDKLKTASADHPGAAGLKSEQIVDPVAPNEKQAGQGQHDKVVLPTGTAAMETRMKEMEKVIASYQEKDKQNFINRIMELKATASLVTASNETQERDSLSKLSIEQLQTKVADLEPIVEKIEELQQRSGSMPSTEGRIVKMPGTATASMGNQPRQYTSLKDIKGGWS